VRSLNPHWTLDGFHARLVALAQVKVGDKVLDLGCGRGNSLAHLLGKVGRAGVVVAADRDGGSLAAIRAKYSNEIADRRLETVEMDLAGTSPFTLASFNVIVCQNVIECIADREALLRELHRILKPRGSALIGHHDFDGVQIASDDRDLTRRLVHGYADHTQHWQDASDGQMGRLLPGLVARSPFDASETETLLFVDLTLSNDSYARVHLDGIVAMSEQFGVPTKDAKAWLRGLAARSDAGTFYYALPWTYVLARKF
jgi:ubiquinone/menaquinone biosynthesis C-methylase UbiE